MARKSRNDEVSPGAVLAEFIGTFMLAFAVLASVNGVLGAIVPTPVVAGFTLALAVLTIGSVSGAHINPGITVGLWSLKKVSTNTAFAYILAQVAGAFTASAVMNTFLDGAMQKVEAGEADFKIFLAEAIGMIFFSFGVAACVRNGYKGVDAAMTVGGSLFLGIIFAAVVSNGILNPAVAFGLGSANVVYLLAPLVGSVVGMNLYEYVAKHK